MEGMLSQDEINALLSGMNLDDSPGEPASGSLTDEVLTEIEKDAIGEIANISMGTSATTLYSLVNQKVNITTPVVEICNWNNVAAEYEAPCVFVQIKYTIGLDGANILVLKEDDVKIITDLMMGGDGTNIDGELGELHLSAISEAMNQMMGSSATSLSSMLGKMIDISPPEASLVKMNETKKPEEVAQFLTGDFVRISFRMQIGELIDSTIMQLYPIDFAKSLYDIFISNQMGGTPEPEPEPEPEPQAPQPTPDMGAGQMNMGMGQTDQSQMNMGMGQMDPSQMNMGMGQMNMGMGQMDPSQMNMGMGQMNMGMNPMGMGMGMPQMGMNPMGMGMGMPQMGMMGQMPQNMNIQTAQFQPFNSNVGNMQSQENIGLIMDVPLEVTVELGRTKKSIAEILDFAPGTIIELDKIAGEPIDVLVNGKFVAKGEVVVIEESFGIRVTDIIK